MSNLLLFVVLVVGTLGLVSGRLAPGEIDRRVDHLLLEIASHREEALKFARSIIYPPPVEAGFLSCKLCKPAFGLVKPVVAMGGTVDEISKAITRICMLFDLAPGGVDICKPTIEAYVKPIVYMIQKKPWISVDDFCGLINSDCGVANATFTGWEIPISGKKPSKEDPPPVPAGVKRAKILQFTDIHLDVDYAFGKNPVCDYPTCCREKHGDPERPELGAGPYGQPGCGLPITALEEVFRKAAKDHGDAKFIFLTGDYINDAVWEYTSEPNGANDRNIKAVTKALKEAFPNTPVFPITGNHETDIVNMYPPPEVLNDFPLDWMYSSVSEHFEEYMGGPGQVALFKYGGFYTVVPTPGLRLVMLNSNICYVQNYWLPFNPVDPFGQLRWFSETMAKAEEAKENVIVLAHIPPGSGDWSYWSKQYNRIITRYSHLIRFTAHGHSHSETYTVSFDSEKEGEDIPNAISFVAPSALADYGGPGFKVYYVDGERQEKSTWEVLDHDTWMLDSASSNAKKEAVWYKHYSASEHFDLKAHRPSDYYDLTLRMVKDKTTRDKFWKVIRKNSTENVWSPCNPNQSEFECNSSILCRTVEYNSADRAICIKIRSMLDGSYVDPKTSRAAANTLLLSALAIPFTVLFSRY